MLCEVDAGWTLLEYFMFKFASLSEKLTKVIYQILLVWEEKQRGGGNVTTFCFSEWQSCAASATASSHIALHIIANFHLEAYMYI